MSRAHHHELDKRGKHPAREEPGKHGEIPRKRDDSDDHRSDPYHPTENAKRYVSAEGNETPRGARG
ncbi:hypothetical protein REX01_002785 [Klebsiella aerogenes]|nr:hypothetical protein [Klebsiella aerogenes]